MHKIKKGIKKKIKGKKNKDAELFTEEELENYKKRKQEKADQEVEFEEPPCIAEKEQIVPSESPTEQTVDKEEKKEDWKNFLASTDTVLKKTSENLEHIKEGSFFQTKKLEEEVADCKEQQVVPSIPVASTTQKKLWVDLDKGGISESEEEEDGDYNTQVESTVEESFQEEPKQPSVELKPITDLPSVDLQDYADEFDTAYVEDVESGRIKLHYIPDSPDEKELNEEDPFDTSVINKVLHIEEEKVEISLAPVKAKKKALVNLGSAVKVLTGESGQDTENKTAVDSNEIDLLCNFDEVVNNASKPDSAGDSGHESPSVTDIIFGNEGCDLSEVAPPLLVEDSEKSISKEYQDKSSCEEVENPQQPDLDELDPFANKDDVNAQEESNLKALVSEFEEIGEKKKEFDDAITDEFDAEFAALAAESVAKEKDKQIDEIGALDEDDPFDTSSVKKILEETEIPSEQTNINTQEKESIKDNILEVPSEAQNNTLKEEEVDPFDTSIVTEVFPADPFELKEQVDLPDTLKPNINEDLEKPIQESDPFDTSFAVGFGKTEIKFLEQELLEGLDKKVEEEEDFDFNPREGEIVESKVADSLLSSSIEDSKGPVLSPLPGNSTEDLDPFDTSFAEKIQIQILEEDLLSSTQGHIDANPEPKENTTQPPVSSILETFVNSEESDPFDTSIADNVGNKKEESAVLVKEKACLKLDFKPPRPPSPASLLITTPVDQNPTLEPVSAKLSESIRKEEEFDPFDTSIAEQFGKTELRVLETQLLTSVKPDSILQADPDFDPRKEEVIPEENKDPIFSSSPTFDQEVPSLIPVQTSDIDNKIDPFDTSIADHLKQSELKDFESELLSDIPEKSGVLHLDFIEKIQEEKTHLSSPARCILATTPTDSNPSLQPAVFAPSSKEEPTAEDVDPFDTSIAEQFGKTELKALEECLFSQDLPKTEAFCLDTSKVSCPPASIEVVKEDSINPDSIFCVSPSVEDIPVLQPSLDTNNLGGIDSEIDPFDTSIADKLGKTEVKALESELFDAGLKRRLSDDEFEPRSEEFKSTRIIK